MYITKEQFNSLKQNDLITISGNQRIVLKNQNGFLTINRIKGLATVLYDGDIRKNIYVIEGKGVCYTYSDL